MTKSTHVARKILCCVGILPLALLPVACGLDVPTLPAGPTGPSGTANAVTLTATPSQLPRDGVSRAIVTVSARDVAGAPLSGQRVIVTATPTDAGLSAAEVTTDATGTATLTVTAPPEDSSASTISVAAQPVGGFSDSSWPRTVVITLIGDTTSPLDPPTVDSVSASPDDPVVDQPAVFMAEASAASGHRIVRYVWNFGDGTTAMSTQPHVVKTYTIPGSYTVLLTVTDDVGGTASATLGVQVVSTQADAPVARFTVTPSEPHAGQAVIFDAGSSSAGDRGVIVRYTWSFGDGSIESTTTPTIDHTYEEARSYAVTLTVTDNLNQTSTVGRQVVVAP